MHFYRKAAFSFTKVSKVSIPVLLDMKGVCKQSPYKQMLTRGQARRWAVMDIHNQNANTNVRFKYAVLVRTHIKHTCAHTHTYAVNKCPGIGIMLL